MTEIIGNLKKYAECTSKNGKQYMQIIVDDVFCFYWGDLCNLPALQIADKVKLIYTDGKFKNATSIVKITVADGGINLSKDLRQDILNFINDGDKSYLEVLRYLQVQGLTDESGTELLDNMQKYGDIFVDRKTDKVKELK